MSLSGMLGKLFGKAAGGDGAKTTPSSGATKKRVVMLRALVNHKGEVRQVKVRMSCGDKALDDKACREVMAMAFAPGHIGNRKQDQWHNMRYEVK